MKHLIIIGARGAGRETYNLALETKEFKNKEFDIKGFLDSKADAFDATPGYPPILSAPETYEIQQDDVFICALGEPKWRKHYAEIILSKGGKFINLIDPSVILGTNSVTGFGCIIQHGVRISCDIKIGNFVYIQSYSVLGHDAKVGNYCHLNTFSFMGGYSELEDMAVLQTKATLVPHRKVGEGGLVGANSVAVKNVKPWTTVMGIPAKKLDF